jgi:hypothetical protein
MSQSPSVPANKHKPIVLNEVESSTELDPTDDVSEFFDKPPPKKTIHIIVQRPPLGNVDALALIRTSRMSLFLLF